ncbi:hypothetical protein [uncultured Olleya sp.]|uniref:hypothetical protein n=1 Tax=uncultured Olleya sp. TaxID=757243 RepID=UPI002598EA08|nr:hypothetical protein [uncultured Olleya sp.]
MKYTIDYVKKVPIWKTILGITTAILCLYIVFSGSIYGIVPIAFSILLLQTEGCQIDLKSNIYRKTYSIVGLNFGKWLPLPKIDYVSIFSTNITTAVWVSTASTNITENIYAINLFCTNNKKIEASTTQHKEEAFNLALLLADALDANMLDATLAGDFKWMDKNQYRDHGRIVYTD